MASASSSVLEMARQSFATSSPEHAHEFISAAYGRHTPRISGDRKRFMFSALSIAVDAFSVARVRHSMHVVAPEAVFDNLCVIRPVSGVCRFTAGREEAGGTSLPILAAPHQALCVEWADSVVGVVRLDADRVFQVAGEVTGVDQDAMRFTGISPRSSTLGRYWDSVVRHVTRHLLPDEELMSSPLVREQAFRQLAAALLTVFPNTSQAYERASGADDAEPTVVRRAVEFIDANAGRDLGVAEIAEASGIGTRGLQAAFRRHRDTTPIEYLRRVRMERAHRDLQAGDPTRGDSVSAIAARWGFTHHGRFAVEYRRAYGCSPGHTLRR